MMAALFEISKELGELLMSDRPGHRVVFPTPIYTREGEYLGMGDANLATAIERGEFESKPESE